MSKKKILIFIDWYLPGYKAGGPIQSIANLVAHLSGEFEFLIVTSDTDYCESTPYRAVKSNEWNTLSDGTKVYYFSKEELTPSNIRKLIQHTAFDCVYLNGIFSLYFTLIPLYLLRKKRDKKIVIAARGMFATSALGVKKTKKQFFLRAVKVLRLFDTVRFHATTQNEKNEILAVLGNITHVQIAGNLPQKIELLPFEESTKSIGAIKLINIARIAPEKNLLFALQVLKETKAFVLFDFYGPIYDTAYWEECKKVMKELPSNVMATYKGVLKSESVLTELEKYDFMFMPTQGENFGHIILQSFAAGIPIIISDQTPWKNLSEKNCGWDIKLSDTQAFLDVIDQCVHLSQEDYCKMSKASYMKAFDYFHDTTILAQNMLLFR